MRLRRIIPRFSLRTLAVFLLLCTSGVGLWWNWGPWVPIRALHEGPFLVEEAVYSPDGSVVLCADVFCGNVRLFDGITGASLVNSELDSAPGRSKWQHAERHLLAFSPDGSKVAAAHRWGDMSGWRWEHGVTVWNVATGEVLLVTHVKGMVPTAVTFSGDGEKLMVKHGTFDGVFVHEEAESEATPPVAHVWDIATGKGPTLLRGEVVESYETCASPDGLRRVDVNPDRTAYMMERVRPDGWGGVFYLWEFWLTVVFAGLFVWGVVRDRRALRKQE